MFSLRALVGKYLHAGWAETVSADNLLAVATHAAGGVGTKHTIKGISFAFSVAPGGSRLYQVKTGTNVRWEGYVDSIQGVQENFPGGIVAADNEAVSVELAASGTATQLGKANIHGVTE